MKNVYLGQKIRALIVMLLLGAVTDLAMLSDAEARAGRGRSMGRSSGFGYRRAAPPPSSPQTPPSQNYGQPGPNYNQPNYNQPNPAMPTPPPSAPQRGGMFRNLAAGMAGGFLGSMLFGSMSHAVGGGYGAGAGRGFGLFELILVAGLAYLAFRWWKSRQTQPAWSTSGPFARQAQVETITPLRAEPSLAIAPSVAATLDPEVATDLFFKVQGAWTRRDLTSVRSFLGAEVVTELEQDLRQLKANGQINRLENISVRSANVVQSWRESDVDFTSVRFTANLLDYTVEEATGKVLDGSDTVPVKFDEVWVFARGREYSDWTLVGIEQA